MKASILAILAMLPLALLAAEPIDLFNGKDLSGWKADIPKADKKPDIQPSFIVRDGKLVSLGNPRGQLLTEESFKNYKLVVEYRFPGKPGNSGVLVHASKLRVRGNMHPQCIEVQLMHGDAGDFWVIEEDIEVPDMKKRRPRQKGQKWGGGQTDARRLLNLTDDSEKPLGEWNTMTIVCRGDEIIVHLNGDKVNHGHKATATEGKIGLQAEGAEVEFSKIELTPLKD
ncbi:MAG: DUF1080 domain-containing protein [Akkermansiaceae bacterium]|nr:DUF1080 domain-containing protein [Akkermansiaceae bacterium]